MPVTTRILDAVSVPMVYVHTRSRTTDDAIRTALGGAFAKLGRFMAETGVAAIAPPVCIYSDWSNDQITVDVGFPVAPDDVGKAKGDVHAGRTPGGPAMKAIHHGPYETIKDTYATMTKAIEAEGARMSGSSWEVYFNDPETTPPADLTTEVYIGLADQAGGRL